LGAAGVRARPLTFLRFIVRGAKASDMLAGLLVLSRRATRPDIRLGGKTTRIDRFLDWRDGLGFTSTSAGSLASLCHQADVVSSFPKNQSG
jgi:hypothetical protein